MASRNRMAITTSSIVETRTETDLSGAQMIDSEVLREFNDRVLSVRAEEWTPFSCVLVYSMDDGTEERKTLKAGEFAGKPQFKDAVANIISLYPLKR